jgi:hypothetical protein
VSTNSKASILFILAQSYKEAGKEPKLLSAFFIFLSYITHPYSIGFIKNNEPIVSRQSGSSTNYLKTNLLKQIKKNISIF